MRAYTRRTTVDRKLKDDRYNSRWLQVLQLVLFNVYIGFLVAIASVHFSVLARNVPTVSFFCICLLEKKNQLWPRYFILIFTYVDS